MLGCRHGLWSQGSPSSGGSSPSRERQEGLRGALPRGEGSSSSRPGYPERLPRGRGAGLLRREGDQAGLVCGGGAEEGWGGRLEGGVSQRGLGAL